MNDDMYISLFDSIPTWVMLLPIFLCSVIACAVMVERSLFYTRINYDYRLIARNCADRIKRRKFDEARIVCGEYSGPIIRIMEASIGGASDGTLQPSFIADLSERSLRKVQKHLGLMSTIATVSPMFGLFGTVTGMMKSFSALTKSGQFAHDLLARGIAEALVTTALGLLVAIPSWIFYNYMVSRVDHYVKETEFVADTLSELNG